MFTGIAEETGKIQTISENGIEIECAKVLEDAKIGDSIAVNGVCLTVIQNSGNSFKADMSPETFRVTAFPYLKAGMHVNLERAMSANGVSAGILFQDILTERQKLSRLAETEKVLI